MAVVGAFSLGTVALHRGESINAVWLVVAAVCVYLIAYRFYSNAASSPLVRKVIALVAKLR